nr:hypothetical protein GCM10017745_41270 [Saccharothrix mutabilis subsp. capreolus]
MHLAPEVCEYAVRVAVGTRSHPAVRWGVSPRGSIALVRAAQAYAATEGRLFVTPDDVKVVAEPVLAHRLVLTADAELTGRTAAAVVADVLGAVPVPPVG